MCTRSDEHEKLLMIVQNFAITSVASQCFREGFSVSGIAAVEAPDWWFPAGLAKEAAGWRIVHQHYSEHILPP